MKNCSEHWHNLDFNGAFEYIPRKAKRIWVRSVISSIKPKSDDWFFVDLQVFSKLLLRNCPDSSTNQIKLKQKQFHVHNLYKVDLSCISLVKMDFFVLGKFFMIREMFVMISTSIIWVLMIQINTQIGVKNKKAIVSLKCIFCRTGDLDWGLP